MSDANTLQVQADSGCFVCGAENPAGLHARLETDRENGSASCQLEIDQRFQGWQGVVHGGILSTLLDEVAIYACRTRGEQFVTTEIKVRFRKPVPVGSRVILSGQIVEIRRRLYQVHSRLEIDGELHAEAEVKILGLDKT